MKPEAAVPAAAGRCDPLPLSALNDHLYCERRAHLKFVDGLRGTNEHTLIGDLAHEAVDTPGYEHRAGWELLRSLPLYSDTLGLTGKADLVEVRRDPSSGHIAEARPVEYKKGPARRWSNDQVHLCAQALCLEEMFGLRIESGLIYHAASAKRDEVFFEAQLRALTLATLDALRATLGRASAPPAVLKPQCDGCSLRGVCLPEAATVRRMSLFKPRDYA
ncbi:MAG: CRISPR-associated protein Cas4 [Opitutae bacterium]|nr:CRISPR-associated protein Cas4 [Opitutae bacterium]